VANLAFVERVVVDDFRQKHRACQRQNGEKSSATNAHFWRFTVGE
jgi:hypothetical protein